MIVLRPLSRAYGAAVAMRNALYDAGSIKAKRLRLPVVSVGNLTAGGAGKTPLVIALVQALARRGYACDVLSRGYGRRTHGVMTVDVRCTAEESGDEPLLIAQRTGVPVYVGESRFAAGLQAERDASSAGEERIHILDDGMQHRQLTRQFEIVMLAGTEGGDHLLPEGRLREPLRNISRADAVVVASGAAVPEAARGKARWRVFRIVDVPRTIAHPVAFCGIARPQRFFDDLRSAGVAPAYSFAFRDHQRFTEREIRQLLQWRDMYRAGGFITTEKDRVRLGRFVEVLKPLEVVRLDLQLEDEDRAVAAILSAIAARRSGPGDRKRA